MLLLTAPSRAHTASATTFNSNQQHEGRTYNRCLLHAGRRGSNELTIAISQYRAVR